MNRPDPAAALERRLDELQKTVEQLRSAQFVVHGEIEELFSATAQALDVVAASLEELAPEDERFGWSDRTGVMGRAFELQSVIRLFRGSLADLHHRLGAGRRSGRELAHRGV